MSSVVVSDCGSLLEDDVQVQRISGDRAFLEAEDGTFRCIEAEGETSRCTRYEPARYDGEHLHGHRDLP